MINDEIPSFVLRQDGYELSYEAEGHYSTVMSKMQEKKAN